MKTLNVEVIRYNNCYGDGYYDMDGSYNDGTSIEGVILAGTFPAWLEKWNADGDEYTQSLKNMSTDELFGIAQHLL